MKLSSVVLLLGMLWPASVHARVERFAVIIGNDHGQASETPLLYAQSDAARVYDVLRELGGFSPVNMVLLNDEGVDVVRGTLIAINERIRRAVSEPDTQVVLLVYYSGHADAEHLHLGATQFAVGELAQLVSGSAANVRLVVLDACRSGSLTRLKGGRVVAPFALPEEQLPGSGMAYLTASAESEDAQESDELRGSFFTHALVSGLLGAADRDGNGEVVLDEAYGYAYESTLRATSRTLAGTQHPTFRFDLRGQGELVLTRLEAHAAQRASLHFPSGLSFLVLRDSSEGAVVAEVAEDSKSHVLSLRPGRYFIRARGPDVLYEGTRDAAPGTSSEVDLGQMRRSDYARLVRKGGRASRVAHGLEAGMSARTALPNASTACLGGFVGYAADFAAFGVGARASACASGFANQTLQAATNAYDLETRLYHAWDLLPLSLELGLGGGASLFTQAFQTQGHAPSRQSVAPFLALTSGVAVELAHGVYAGLDLAAETHFLWLQRTGPEPARTQVGFALRTCLGLSKRF